MNTMMSVHDFKTRPEQRISYQLSEAISKKFVKPSLQYASTLTEEFLTSGGFVEKTRVIQYKGDNRFLAQMGKLACFLYSIAVSEDKDATSFLNEMLHAYICDGETDYISPKELQEGLDHMRGTEHYASFKKAASKMDVAWDKMDFVLFFIEELLDMIKTQSQGNTKIKQDVLHAQLVALDIQDMFILWFLWSNFF